MANVHLLALMAGLPLVLLANPAASDTYVGLGRPVCLVQAAFSGNVITIRSAIDQSGNPTSEFRVIQKPAGTRDDLSIFAGYPMKKGPSVGALADLEARATVSRSMTDGIFLLTVGDQEYRSYRPGMVFTGDPNLHGEAQVWQFFDVKGPLLDAITNGGSIRLAYLDKKGIAISQTDLTFASKTAVLSAVEKAYPTVLTQAKKMANC